MPAGRDRRRRRRDESWEAAWGRPVRARRRSGSAPRRHFDGAASRRRSSAARSPRVCSRKLAALSPVLLSSTDVAGRPDPTPPSSLGTRLSASCPDRGAGGGTGGPGGCVGRRLPELHADPQSAGPAPAHELGADPAAGALLALLLCACAGKQPKPDEPPVKSLKSKGRRRCRRGHRGPHPHRRAVLVALRGHALLRPQRLAGGPAAHRALLPGPGLLPGAGASTDEVRPRGRTASRSRWR